MSGRNTILIGFMGAGKTSVGNRLSGLCGKPLIDTDQMIEERAGMSISRLFETSGEAAFRQLETQVLEELLDQAEGEVISVGGGLPLREENRILLRKLGHVVYLQVQPETVLERLRGDTTRPLLQGDGMEEKVKNLLAYRGPIYHNAAHAVVAVDGKSIDRIAEEIKEGSGDDEAVSAERAEY